MKLRMYLRGLGLGMIVAALVLSFGIKTDNKTMTDAQVRARAKELGMVDESTTLKSSEEKKEEQAVTPSEEKKEEPAVTPSEKKKEEPAVTPSEEKKEEPAVTPSEEKKEEPTVTPSPSEEDSKTKENNKEEAKTTPAADDKKADKSTSLADKDQKTDSKDSKANKDNTDSTEKTDKFVDEKKDKPAKADTGKVVTKKTYTLTIMGGYSSDKVARILEDAGIVDSAASFDKYLCDNKYDHRISTGTYVIPAGSDYASIARIITNSK